MSFLSVFGLFQNFTFQLAAPYLYHKTNGQLSIPIYLLNRDFGIVERSILTIKHPIAAWNVPVLPLETTILLINKNTKKSF